MDESKKLRICILGPAYSVHMGRWVRGLRESGHHIDLLTFRTDFENSLGAIDLGARSKFFYLSRISLLQALVKRLQPDIFHAHYASSYGFLASFIAHPRKVVSVWGDDIVVFPRKNALARLIIKRSIGRAHRITATSHFLDEIAQTYNSRKVPIEVIPFGIDLERFPLIQKPSSAVIKIGFAKSLTPKYGIDVLLRAFRIVIDQNPNVELHLVGRGPQESEYRNLAHHLNLESKTRFCGYIEHENMPGFLANLDIFVMPSLTDGESFGVAALEASATGLPVVATRVGGVPEVIDDGITGFLVERGNAIKLAEALKRLILNPDLRTRMGLAGRKLVENKYDWKCNLDDMQKLYWGMMK